MILVLSGATASGKSKLALELAKAIDGEIVNADAFQVYKGIEIATAAPKEEEKKSVPHHLYGYLSVDEEYSIARYQTDARRIITDILKRKKTPILVGGSGLYIRSALYDYDLSVDTSDVDMTKYLALDDIALHKVLEQLDPEEANKIHPNNRRRVYRDIEICLALGKSKTEFLKEQKHEPIYPTKFFILKKSRDSLYEISSLRVDKMFEDGLLEQIVPMIEKYGENAPAFKAIGIKEIFPYLHHEKSLEEAKEDIKKNTKHYIKRQETFFAYQFPSIYVSSLEDIIENIND